RSHLALCIRRRHAKPRLRSVNGQTGEGCGPLGCCFSESWGCRDPTLSGIQRLQDRALLHGAFTRAAATCAPCPAETEAGGTPVPRINAIRGPAFLPERRTWPKVLRVRSEPLGFVAVRGGLAERRE